MQVNKEVIIGLLNEIPDPEIPVVSIVELGMIKDVFIEDRGHVQIQIMPTYTACPATWQIQQDIEKKMQEHGISAKVDIVYSPAWTTDRILPAALQKLKEYGIAPPQNGVSIHSLVEKNYQIQCPHCGSLNTELVSSFGSTPCKALFKCNVCKEPFDYFKCHR